MEQQFQKITYIALRRNDGSLLINVPLFVRVADLQANGISDSQEQLLHRISEIMCRHYEQRLTDHFSKLKGKADDG